MASCTTVTQDQAVNMIAQAPPSLVKADTLAWLEGLPPATCWDVFVDIAGDADFLLVYLSEKIRQGEPHLVVHVGESSERPYRVLCSSSDSI
jgi:hypothetical protein